MPILFVIGAYLWGGIPSAYLVARYKAGIDIRQYGSGNVGAANVFSHVGKWTGIIMGTFDCVGKGVLPVLAARYLYDQSLGVQAARAWSGADRSRATAPRAVTQSRPPHQAGLPAGGILPRASLPPSWSPRTRRGKTEL